MIDFAERKVSLAQEIFALVHEAELTEMEKALARMRRDKVLIARHARPLRQKTTLEQLKKEQNYRGFDRARWDGLIAEMDVQDAADELLTMLSK